MDEDCTWTWDSGEGAQFYLGKASRCMGGWIRGSEKENKKWHNQITGGVNPSTKTNQIFPFITLSFTASFHTFNLPSSSPNLTPFYIYIFHFVLIYSIIYIVLLDLYAMLIHRKFSISYSHILNIYTLTFYSQLIDHTLKQLTLPIYIT